MSRAWKTLGAKLPKGWGDAGRQICILVGVDIAYELVRGICRDLQRSSTTSEAPPARMLSRWLNSATRFT